MKHHNLAGGNDFQHAEFSDITSDIYGYYIKNVEWVSHCKLNSQTSNVQQSN